MPAKVVDAPALAPLVYGAPKGPGMTWRLRASRLFAPALVALEVASICVKKPRRYPEQRKTLLGASQILPRIAIERIDVHHGWVSRWR